MPVIALTFSNPCDDMPAFALTFSNPCDDMPEIPGTFSNPYGTNISGISVCFGRKIWWFQIFFVSLRHSNNTITKENKV
jgi:hypothetical protein